MNRAHIIIIVDRSELASNLYRLLLKPTGAALIVRKRFEEARPHFFRRVRIDLAIFNSNIFGKKFLEISKRIDEDEPVRNAKKIFILRDSPAEDDWRDRLSRIPNSTIIIRPFHPDEFKEVVDKLLC